MSFLLLLLAIVATAVLLPGRPSRRLAGVGASLLALGVAGFAAALGGAPLDRLRPADLAGLPRSFLGVSGSLLLLAAGLLLAAAARDLRRRRDQGLARVPGGLLLLLAAGLLALSAPVLSEGGLVFSALLAFGAACTAMALGWLGGWLRLGWGLRWLDRRVLAPGSASADRQPRLYQDGKLLALVGLGAGGALLGNSLPLVFGGAVLVALGAHIVARRRSLVPALPVLPLLALALVPAAWLLATIAGSASQSLAQLAAAPFSPAAEVLVVALLAIAAWGFLALWPVHGWVPGAVLAPVGGALLVRVAAAMLPDGVAHWNPVIFPLGVVAVWYGAAVYRPPQVLCGLGVLGVASLDPGGVTAGQVLFWVAALAGVGERPEVRRFVAGAPWLRLAAILPAWAGVQVLAAGLRAQTVYTTMAALGLAAAVWRNPELSQKGPLECDGDHLATAVRGFGTKDA